MIQKRTTNSNPMMSVLPLRDIVVFPQMVVPLFVGREKSLSALRNVTSSEKANKELLLVAQRDAGIEDPSSDDLFDVGTVARVVQSLKLPDGTFKVLVEGIRRVRVTQYKEDEQIFAEVEDIPQDKISQRTFEPLRRTILTAFTEYQKNNKRITNDQLNRISSLTDPEQLITSIAQLLVLSPSRKQDLLATVGTKDRLELLFDMLEEEVDIQQTEKRIRGRVKKAMEKNQRDYYLNEQVKAIQKELGDTDEEFEEIERKIKAAKMSPEGEEKALGELKKLRLQGQNSAEANVIRNYIDTLISLPWSKRTRVNTNLIKAEAVLEEDHYGLEKVKERILEYLAVQSRVKNVKSPILCLVGPPGFFRAVLRSDGHVARRIPPPLCRRRPDRPFARVKTTPSPETRRCFLSSRTPPQPFCATFIIGLKRMQYDDERIFYGRIGRIGRVGRGAGAGGVLGKTDRLLSFIMIINRICHIEEHQHLR